MSLLSVAARVPATVKADLLRKSGIAGMTIGEYIALELCMLAENKSTNINQAEINKTEIQPKISGNSNKSEAEIKTLKGKLKELTASNQGLKGELDLLKKEPIKKVDSGLKRLEKIEEFVKTYEKERFLKIDGKYKSSAAAQDWEGVKKSVGASWKPILIKK
jgi:hypothetical protein